jgi:hypothetical protein
MWRNEARYFGIRWDFAVNAHFRFYGFRFRGVDGLHCNCHRHGLGRCKMTDQPELYRVQTTAGKSVVVQRHSEGGYIMVSGLLSWKLNGKPFAADRWAPLDLTTLIRLHLLTDAELQARDAELLERVAEKFDCATQDGQGDDRRAVADEIRAMKGQTHER